MDSTKKTWPEWVSPDGSIRLINADCREVLPLISGIDCIITDPPYKIRAGNGGGVFGQRKHLVETGGFTDGGCDFSFLDRHKNWFSFCSRQQLKDLLEAAEKRDRYNVLVWCKPNPVPTCHNKYLPDLEFIVHGFSKGRLFGDMDVKSQFMVYPCGQKETDHPNEKPVPLIEKLIHLGSLESETIADPYMGSGSTGIACIRNNRRFIGIEDDTAHFKKTVKRIQQELSRDPLFDLPITTTQPSLFAV